MARIDTVDSRVKLKPRHEPYWQRLSAGCYLGFRKLTPTSVGSWISVYRDANSNKRTKHSLGDFSQLPASQRYDAAKQYADAWFNHLGRGGSPEVFTVQTACEKWVAHKKNIKGEVAANEATARLNRWVYKEKIAKIPLNKLTRNHIDVWRTSMSNTKVVINPHSDKKKTRQRSSSTVNRDMSELKAALNFAYDNNWISDDSSWRQSLKSIKNAGQRRGIYLDKEQRKRLIQVSEVNFGNFITALSLIPLRPGALVELVSGNFDSRLGVLTVGKDKHGQDRRIKLPESTASFLTKQCQNKKVDQLIFTRADGKAWDRHTWKKIFNEAAKTAKLPPKSTLYALRHSGITDLVTNGLDLLTTALISGTSVAMIEKHYGHFRQDHAAQALEKLNLN